MKIVLSPRAQRDLANQLDYLIEQGAAKPARNLKTRDIERFARVLR